MPSVANGADLSQKHPALGDEPGVQLTLSQAELVDRIRWLIDLRWIAFGGVSITVLVARELFRAPLPWGWLFLTACAIPFYNLIFLIAWLHIRRGGMKRVERASSRIANGQILCDLLILGALIHLSGGVENLFCFYFVFHMVIASILLSARAAFTQATVAVLIFATVAIGEYVGLLPHYNSPINVTGADLHTNKLFVFAAVWVLTSSLCVTVYLATSISTRLRYREDQVALLSRQVQQRAEELEKACDELASMEKAKSAYARKVAHEIRSPLAAIDSLLQAVSDGLVGEVPEQLREMICRSRNRTQELLALVYDLLALAAAREAARGSERTVGDLRVVLDEVVSVLSAQAEMRSIMLKTEVCLDSPMVRADQEGMKQVLTNLISNAIKYSPEGGLVDIRIVQAGPEVEIRVSDSGIGIDEADLARVFDEFYRAANARDVTTEGTGLGLSIVKNIVAAHGGTVAVESRRGECTTFTVRMPISSYPEVGS